eukprot:sb/3479172/
MVAFGIFHSTSVFLFKSNLRTFISIFLEFQDSNSVCYVFSHRLDKLLRSYQYINRSDYPAVTAAVPLLCPCRIWAEYKHRYYYYYYYRKSRAYYV